MDQLRKLIARLTLSQRISLAAMALLVAGGLIGFTQWRREADFRPLYTGLAPEDAAAIVQKLKENGSDYRLSENGTTVLAPSARLAELRLQMAAGGLPKSGRMGFELFDKTSFGVTDFAEHVNYRRALEGELERTIISLAEVERARVHLTFPKESVYLEARQAAKASVVLGLRPAAQLSPQNVMAVCHLVASAVEGLAPEQVSVIDTRGNLLNRPRHTGAADDLEGSAANLEYRDLLEKSLLGKIQATLDPLLGAGRFQAAVSAECDFSSGEQSEESFDPTRSVMVSSQKSEDVAPALLSGGLPGTASNLPRPPARASGGAAAASRRNEEITYQSSRTVRLTRMPQGELKRVSVSLLIDQDVRWEGRQPHLQQVLVPPSPEKMKTIRDLVAGAIDFKADRGDQLIVETLPFESTLHSEPPQAPPIAIEGPPVPGSKWEVWRRDPRLLGSAAGAGLLLAVAGVFLLRRMRMARRRAAPEIAGELPARKDAEAVPAADPKIKRIEATTEDDAQVRAQLEADVLRAIKVPAAASQKKEALSKYLREMLKKDPIPQVQTLRTWLNEKT